jgi:putative FmdB family regulatory protein
MPRYEYKCNNKKCETDTFEEIQSFTDKPKAKCPDCNKITKDKKSVYGFNFTI